VKATAARVSSFGVNPFAAMTQLANESGAVNLGQGFPDYAPPAFVLEAAREAFSGTHHQYAPPKGWPRLQRAVSSALSGSLGFEANPDLEITITHGATEAMHAATQALLEPGDEAIILEPFYDMYAPQVGFTGATAKYVALERDAGIWKLDLEKLRAACSSRTKVLILNTPHNPTGKVFSRAELEGIAALALEFDFYVLCDEAYDRLIFDVAHISIASLPGMRERSVTIGSAGKTFNVTGWRVGWCIASPNVSAAIRRGHQWVPFAASTPVQEAVAICLEQAPSLNYFRDLPASLSLKRDALLEMLRDANLEPEVPDGGYFVIAPTHRFAANTDEAAQRFVREFGIAAIPMTVFYAPEHRHLAPNCLRFAFCKSEATLAAAAQRFSNPELSRLT
jgi:aspartate/methionine/tyrosine aminotransferase